MGTNVDRPEGVVVWMPAAPRLQNSRCVFKRVCRNQPGRVGADAPAAEDLRFRHVPPQSDGIIHWNAVEADRQLVRAYSIPQGFLTEPTSKTPAPSTNRTLANRQATSFRPGPFSLLKLGCRYLAPALITWINQPPLKDAFCYRAPKSPIEQRHGD